jgi:hypothetical protein
MPEQMRDLIADARLRRHGWIAFERGVRRAALRLIREQDARVGAADELF